MAAIEVVLTEREQELCAFVARQRDEAGEAAGADAGKFGNRRPTGEVHLEGCLGECAAAKGLNFYWTGAGTHYREDADVAFVQVRQTAVESGRLLIRPADEAALGLPWVLVIALGEGRYRLPGWLVGREALQERWLDDPGARGAVWMVPQRALRDFADADWLMARVCILPEVA